ncbi:hypothetical protein AVEN_172839-1 [Araneus ventricosus]|uniref:Endonuclease/exonuclease/phosphatase domain-containing protein n=1 Tax=Araneus ventricosus TaxID=182803 RepID=A0A4Y2S7Q5_ARAVE|nr:hypothetical protein AVEN_172839-1 [Araneus ventricosus]
MDIDIVNLMDSPPTFDSDRGKSWIDLTLTRNIQTNYIQNWKVNSETTHSDHKLITFFIKEAKSSVTKKSRWKLEKLKLIDFRRDLCCLIQTFCDIEIKKSNFTEVMRVLEEGLNLICENNCKKKSLREKQSAIWWSPNLEMMRSKTRALRRRYQRTRDDEERNRRKIIAKNMQNATE